MYNINVKTKEKGKFRMIQAVSLETVHTHTHTQICLVNKKIIIDKRKKIVIKPMQKIGLYCYLFIFTF